MPTEHATCTLCAAVESPGFYTGCMFLAGENCNGWTCDGKGNLVRDTAAAVAWCTFCKTRHPGGASCLGHYP